MTCYDNPSFALFDHLLVVLQDGVNVSQLRVVWQKVNLMKVVFDFFPVGINQLDQNCLPSTSLTF